LIVSQSLRSIFGKWQDHQQCSKNYRAASSCLWLIRPIFLLGYRTIDEWFNTAIYFLFTVNPFYSWCVERLDIFSSIFFAIVTTTIVIVTVHLSIEYFLHYPIVIIFSVCARSSMMIMINIKWVWISISCLNFYKFNYDCEFTEHPRLHEDSHSIHAILWSFWQQQVLLWLFRWWWWWIWQRSNWCWQWVLSIKVVLC